MFEFAAGEFDSIMLGRSTFRKVPVDPMIAGGSLVLGVEQLRYTDGHMMVEFISDAGSMHLSIIHTKGKVRTTLIDEKFTDFGAVREAVREHLGD